MARREQQESVREDHRDRVQFAASYHGAPLPEPPTQRVTHLALFAGSLYGVALAAVFWVLAQAFTGPQAVDLVAARVEYLEAFADSLQGELGRLSEVCR